VVELVDTQDLKSCGPKGPCGFDSRPGYKKYGSVAQWIEQQPSKLWVDGSNPSGITTMKRINILLLVGGMFCFGMGYFTSKTIVLSLMSKPNSTNNTRLVYINDSLKNEITSKDSLIFEVTEERDFFELQTDEMSDEMAFKESEISYWGRKYDSTKVELNKLKRK
jgi:hypothetical protein